MSTEPAPTKGPTNVCVVLLDSLNRHMLGSYGGTEFTTPNLDRFARERATRFTRHVTGSLPCMPARRATGAAVGNHHLYDLGVDPDEQENRVGEAREAQMVELLRTALTELEAPAEQLERLGIA